MQIRLRTKDANLTALRVLIAGGGTGGHIIPALAVAHELKARYGAEVLFLGTERGLETRLVPAVGFRLQVIEVGPLKNVSIRTRIKTLLSLPRSFRDCKKIIREFNPSVVLGVGGFASGPGVGAALQLKVPAMTFEPNAYPGLANRLVGKRVQASAINFPAAAKWFSNPEVTGIPVRPEFFAIRPLVDAPLHLLVFGGSQGARILNTLVPALIKELLDAVPGLTVTHQSGSRNLDSTLAAYLESGADPTHWRVQPFIEDMPAAFAHAHLVLSRSGASTVAELAAAGKPSLLIPFAAAADEHQRRNAEAMVEAGAAIMLQEKELDNLSNDPRGKPRKLLTTLIDLLSHPDKLAAMGAAARKQAHPDAAERIAARVAQLGTDPSL